MQNYATSGNMQQWKYSNIQKKNYMQKYVKLFTNM